jgi:hypothetical protein
MGIGKASDFVIYQEQFYAGMTEVLAQNSNAFNGASNGTMIMDARQLKGDYEQESFFQAISALATRRDTTSTALAADTPMTQAELVAVKLNRKIGPIANTLDSIRKIASDAAEFSFLLGQQIGKAISVDWANTSILAGYTALSGQASVINDQSATGTPTHGMLVNTIAKLGDRGQDIGMWVMHSKSYYDLVGSAITTNIYDVGSIAIKEGNTPTLGRPTLVIDAPALLNAVPAPDQYHIMGLTPGAIKATESEEREIVSETVTGLENLVLRIQGEYAFNVGVKGYAWDIAAGGANPTDAALGTNTNWDLVASDIKDQAGVLLIAQ